MRVSLVTNFECEFWGVISLKKRRKFKKINKNFIIYNIKIITTYSIQNLLLEFGISSIESKNMIMYLMYKYMIPYTKDKRFPTITSVLSQRHLCIYKGQHEDVNSQLNNWSMDYESLCRILRPFINLKCGAIKR